jgi:hypothetical protein
MSSVQGSCLVYTANSFDLGVWAITCMAGMGPLQWERQFSHMHECIYTYNNLICSGGVDHCKHGIQYLGWEHVRV